MTEAVQPCVRGERLTHDRAPLLGIQVSYFPGNDLLCTEVDQLGLAVIGVQVGAAQLDAQKVSLVVTEKSSSAWSLSPFSASTVR